jgi:DHA1 family bicyclomycin/chloramphenicol resistance-like MFS transporter
MICAPISRTSASRSPVISSASPWGSWGLDLCSTGLVIYILAAAGCGLSPSISWLVLQRFFLALGSCVGIVAARAIVRDLFPVHEVAKVFSTLMLVLAISPIIAPSVGAFVADTFSWRLIFAVLAAIAGVILYGVTRYLPESKHADTSVSLHPVQIARDYSRLLKEPAFVAYGLASAAASAGLFAYISDAPFVFMTLFGFNEQQFGFVFSVSAAGVVGASQLNRLWLRRRNSGTISFSSVLAQCVVGGILMASVLLSAPVSIVLIVIIGYLVCIGFLSPNTTALAIEPFSKNAGAASALMGSAQMAAGALASALVSALHTGTAVPMAGILTASAVGSLGVQAWYRRHLHRTQTTVTTSTS